MIRTCLEFLLSHSFDSKRPPSAWLQRLVARDPHLKQYEADARQIDALLQTSAEARRRAMAAEVIAVETVEFAPLPSRQTAGPSSTLSAAWLTGLAAAAVLLIAAAPSLFRPATPEVHAGEFSQQLSVVPGEVLRLITSAVKTSQTRVPQLSPLSVISMPELPAWEEVVAGNVNAPVRQEIDAWQQALSKLTLQLTDPDLEK